MADDIRVNNNQYSWGSIVAKVDGDRYTGFTSITYSDKRERIHAYGMGAHHAPRGRSRGKYTVEVCKIVGWRGSIATLRQALANRAPDGISYGNVEVQWVVQYVEPGENGGNGITVELDRCVWVSNNASDEESADPLKEEIEFQPMLIRRNGLVLFDSTLGEP